MAKTSTITPVRRIGVFPQDTFLSYWLFSDGNVWYCDGRPVSNMGPVETFLERAKAGRYRITLDSENLRQDT